MLLKWCSNRFLLLLSHDVQGHFYTTNTIVLLYTMHLLFPYSWKWSLVLQHSRTFFIIMMHRIALYLRPPFIGISRSRRFSPMETQKTCHRPPLVPHMIWLTSCIHILAIIDQGERGSIQVIQFQLSYKKIDGLYVHNLTVFEHSFIFNFFWSYTFWKTLLRCHWLEKINGVFEPHNKAVNILRCIIKVETRSRCCRHA